MTNYLLIALLVLAVLIVGLQLFALFRKANVDFSPMKKALRSIEDTQERNDHAARQDIAAAKQELAARLVQTRDEMKGTVEHFVNLLYLHLVPLLKNHEQKIDNIRDYVDLRLQLTQEDIGKNLDQARHDNLEASKSLREDLNAVHRTSNSVMTTVGKMGALQKNHLVGFASGLRTLASETKKTLDEQRATIDARLSRIQEDGGNSLRQLREELGDTMRGMSEAQQSQTAALLANLDRLTDSNERRLEAVKLAVEQRLQGIQDDNARQLEQMHAAVDNKLHGMLEQRLGESFKLLGERLDAVHTGLGEMKSLAVGVGDLKKVLTNVNTRDAVGEVLLGNLLQGILAPGQYAANVATKDPQERVEYAIKLPGRGDRPEEAVWLPISAKFPREEYERLIDARDGSGPAAAEIAGQSFEKTVRGYAAMICDKYLNPPGTTEFGIMFLPSEGLYAEVARRVGLIENIQREFRVVITGPTTAAALFNGLQMGFKTLADRKRPSRFRSVFGDGPFSIFAGALRRFKGKLDQDNDGRDPVGPSSKKINRRLPSMPALPGADAGTPRLPGEEIKGPGVPVVAGQDGEKQS